MATSAFSFSFLFFFPLLWGEFLQPGEEKKEKEKKRGDAKSYKGIFLRGKNGSKLTHL
jgi:hypothetical protein